VNKALPPLASLAALALAACGGPRAEALSRLRKSDVNELRTDVARLHTQYFAAQTQTFFPLTPIAWPASTKRMKPIRLNLYHDGLAIALRQEPGNEFGLHIVPPGMKDPPQPTPYISYERIEDGIYYYSLKR
jgi:hypothetical protein